MNGEFRRGYVGLIAYYNVVGALLVAADGADVIFAVCMRRRVETFAAYAAFVPVNEAVALPDVCLICMRGFVQSHVGERRFPIFVGEGAAAARTQIVADVALLCTGGLFFVHARHIVPERGN